MENKPRKKPFLIIMIILGSAFILFLLFTSFGNKNDDKALARKCEKATTKIKDAVAQMNYCQSPEDCVLLNGCPYGCNNLINKNADMSEFTRLNREYRELCGECDLNPGSCSNAIKSGEITCENGKCGADKN